MYGSYRNFGTTSTPELLAEQVGVRYRAAFTMYKSDVHVYRLVVMCKDVGNQQENKVKERALEGACGDP